MHFIYSIARELFFCSMLSFSMDPITTKNRRRIFFPNGKWIVYCVLCLPRRSRRLVIYLFICACSMPFYTLPYHIIPCRPVCWVFSILWARICSIFLSKRNGFGICSSFLLSLYLFRCENRWKYIWQTNYFVARKQIVIMWLKLG